MRVDRKTDIHRHADGIPLPLLGEVTRAVIKLVTFSKNLFTAKATTQPVTKKQTKTNIRNFTLYE